MNEYQLNLINFLVSFAFIQELFGDKLIDEPELITMKEALIKKYQFPKNSIVEKLTCY